VRSYCVHPRATVTIRGTSIDSGEWSQSISVSQGLETFFDIVVTSEDGKSKKTYHIAVNRAYSLSVKADSNGTVEPEGSVDAFVSVPFTLEAEPAYGFYFDGWEVTEGEARIDATEETSSEVTVSATASVMAHFKRKMYHLALTSDGNGTTEGPDSVYHEEQDTIKAVANHGYHFDRWETVSGSIELDDEDDPVTLVALDSGNAVLQARFSIDHYSLTVVSGDNGEADGSATVAYNEWTTVTARPSEGYHFAGWQTDSGTATFEDADDDTTRVRLTNGDTRIRGTFAINTYILSLVEDGNGSTEGDGAVEHGDPVTITALPQNGYPFIRWDLIEGDAQITDAMASETTVRVSGDATIIARFMKYDTIYVDATADDGNAGNSWEHALNNLQTALTYAHEGSVIHITEGTYHPSEADRDVAFVVLNGMKLYGGYPSGGGTKNASTHPVILSGELQNDGDTTNNSSRVVFMENVDASCVIDGITVTGGYAVSSPRGAGMMIQNGSPEISHCVFSRNYCLADESSDSCRGSALYIAGGSPVVQHCTFSDNKCLLDESESPSGIHSKFSGGAVYSSGGEPYFDDCIFNDNQCYNRYWNSDGGSLYMTNGTLDNCIFTSNSIVGTDYGSYRYGGAIYMQNGSVLNCTFSANQISEAFYSNGGALYMETGTVDGCTFSGNHCSSHDAGIYGGAVEAKGGIIRHCIFTGNFCDTAQSAYAQSYGGAIYVSAATDVSVMSCSFNGNMIGSSRSSGGALFIHTNGANVAVTNCTFSGNSGLGRTRSFGGAIAVNIVTGNFYLTNCTLTDNEINSDSAVGGALYISNISANDVILTNCIFWENNAGYDPEISGDASTIRNCVIQGGYSGGGDVSQLYTTDPQLGELDDNGGPVLTISITAGASAHNHGTTSVPGGVDISADARGVSRGTQPDIGAYEISD
jgi:hypothetical protein